MAVPVLDPCAFCDLFISCAGTNDKLAELVESYGFVSGRSRVLDGLWAVKSEGVGLIIRAVSFQDFQPM